MSKVKIEGNASGTGTFTIAAPNSNSDRTLTLPDEAGTVLTSASSTSFPSDIYKKTNIVGTVSQSGGVPTGAILETGSNGNGYYTKYADGMMICFGTTTTGSAIDPGSAYIPRYYADWSWTYPAAFTVTPSLAGSGYVGSHTMILSFGGSGTSSAYGYFASNYNSGYTASKTIELIAIGRWY